MGLGEIFDDRRCCMNCKHAKHFQFGNEDYSCLNASSEYYHKVRKPYDICNLHRDKDGYDNLLGR